MIASLTYTRFLLSFALEIHVLMLILLGARDLLVNELDLLLTNKRNLECDQCFVFSSPARFEKVLENG